jgi:hypothetical protein
VKRIAFLGPSRPTAIPRGITVLPPARQGDVWRALEQRPVAIALIDGVFEHQPSVWHREILDALSEGVRVLGAASMGALRAAELHPFGMVPVGVIAREYASGARVDDSDVALLHADASHDFRPLTVPLVDVQHAIALARRKRAITPRDAAELTRAAETLHYTERTWGRLNQVARLGSDGWRNFLLKGPPSLKSKDAVLCLEKLAALRTKATTRPRVGLGSSFQRRQRLLATGQAIPEPSRRELEAAERLAHELNIDPEADPSGLPGFAHRLLHDGLLRVDR